MRDNIMITFANQKGGVGKTTLCTMFADYLAAKGESVLVGILTDSRPFTPNERRM